VPKTYFNGCAADPIIGSQRPGAASDFGSITTLLLPAPQEDPSVIGRIAHQWALNAGYKATSTACAAPRGRLCDAARGALRSRIK